MLSSIVGSSLIKGLPLSSPSTLSALTPSIKNLTGLRGLFVNNGAILAKNAKGFRTNVPAMKTASFSLRNQKQSAMSNTIPKRDFFRVVQQGTYAYRLTLGKNPVLLEPGFHIVIPVIQTTQVVDMREICLPINELRAFTKDNVPVIVSGSLFFQVEDGFKFCFAVQNAMEAVTNVGESAFRSVCGTLNYDDITSDRNNINRRLCDAVGHSTAEWGVKTTKFEIQRFEPQNKEVQRQLELQMEAERRRRQQELDTMATINVSDGQRQSMILQSQGVLEAQKNRADGEFYTSAKKADAEKYSMLQNAVGLKEQISVLTKELGSAEEAAKFLLELRKWDAMDSIAKSPNNNTYFIPDAKNLLAISPQNSPNASPAPALSDEIAKLAKKANL
eukprot:TRINITY_DN7134_c0_g1_i1.p1 TRINITY_DN7134_c0_g1~~TRINITY_DN7134_c0_g1_i1.p1  ORF type:complete len:389 (+),score=139.03 TRINITY_DN7134_c0_g1_i1:154-1320(+)